MGQESTLPLTDETFQPGEVMSEVFSEDELKAGDVIRLWSDDLPYTFGTKGWMPQWWWSEVLKTSEHRVYLKDLESGEEYDHSISGNAPYGLRGYKHPNPKRFLGNTEAKPSQAAENHCACCGKDLGTRWHYGFESIRMAATIGAQCPVCGQTVCKDDLKFGPDGNYSPCPNCGAKIQVMVDGPAYSSMVEQARSQQRYRGAIKEPSRLGRPVKQE